MGKEELQKTLQRKNSFSSSDVARPHLEMNHAPLQRRESFANNNMPQLNMDHVEHVEHVEQVEQPQQVEQLQNQSVSEEKKKDMIKLRNAMNKKGQFQLDDHTTIDSGLLQLPVQSKKSRIESYLDGLKHDKHHLYDNVNKDDTSNPNAAPKLAHILSKQMIEDNRNKSDAFMELQDSITELNRLIGDVHVRFHPEELTPEQAEAVARCSHAAKEYIANHSVVDKHPMLSRLAKLRSGSAAVRRMNQAYTILHMTNTLLSLGAQKVREDLNQKGELTQMEQETAYDSEIKKEGKIASLMVSAKLKDSKPKKRLKEMVSQYEVISQTIDQDQTLSDLAKAEEKLHFFSVYRDAMTAYAEKKNFDFNKMDSDIADMYSELNRLENMMLLLSSKKVSQDYMKEEFVKQQADILDKKEKFATENRLDLKTDEGLTDKQLASINEIDRWVIRNINNGGILHIASNEVNLTSVLLSMSRRERLNVYYLVQTGARKNPTADKVLDAQNFVLDINKFKGQMIATKAKIFSRLTGAYIYWNKIAQAIRITRSQRALIETAAETAEQIEAKKASLIELQDREEIEENLNKEQNKEQIKDTRSEEEKQLNKLGRKSGICICDIRSSLINAQKLQLSIDQEKNESKKQQLITKRDDLLREAENHKQTLIEINSNIADMLKSMKPAEKSDETQNIAYNGSFFSSNINQLTPLSYYAEVFTQSTAWLKGINIGSSVLSTGLMGLLSGFTVLGSLDLLVNHAVDMTPWEFTENLIAAIKPFTTLALGSIKTINNFLNVSKNMAERALETSTNLLPKTPFEIAGVVGGALEMGYGITQGISYLSRRSSIRKMGNDLVEKKTRVLLSNPEYLKLKKEHDFETDPAKKAEQEKQMNEIEEQLFGYENNMRKIADQLATRKGNRALWGIGIGLATLASVVIPGVGAVVYTGMALSLALGIVQSIHEGANLGGTQTMMFDSYFNMKDVFAKADEAAKKKRGGKEVDPKKQAEFHDAIRLRVANNMGFSDLDEASKHIANNYAEHVYRNLTQEVSEQDRQVYIDLLHSLGLKYKVEDGVMVKPTKEKIARALYGA